MRTILTGLLMMAVSSCSILPKVQPSAVHDLGYPNPNMSPEITALPQQSPMTVEAPKWLSDNRIRYRLLYATPTQVRFYSLDRWIAPPPELFEQLLNASGKRRPNPVNIQLDGFEQQFDAPGRAKVIMHFTATTITGNNKVKSTRQNFYLQQPCLTPDAIGAVDGFTLLTRQAVDTIQAWLRETH